MERTNQKKAPKLKEQSFFIPIKLMKLEKFNQLLNNNRWKQKDDIWLVLRTLTVKHNRTGRTIKKKSTVIVAMKAPKFLLQLEAFPFFEETSLFPVPEATQSNLEGGIDNCCIAIWPKLYCFQVGSIHLERPAFYNCPTTNAKIILLSTMIPEKGE